MISKELILIIFLLALLSFPFIVQSQEKIEIQTVYSVILEIFEDDRTILNSIEAIDGTITTFPTYQTDYSLKIFSHDRKELFKSYLGVSFTINAGDAGVIKLDNTTIHFRAPYYPTAKYMAIYHESKNIFEIDLSKSVCNKNAVCDLGENEYNCPGDCKTKEGVSSWLYIFILIAIISTVAFLILLKFKPKSQSYSNLYQKWK